MLNSVIRKILLENKRCDKWTSTEPLVEKGFSAAHLHWMRAKDYIHESRRNGRLSIKLNLNGYHYLKAIDEKEAH